MVETRLCFYLGVQLFSLSIWVATVVALAVQLADVNLLHGSTCSHTSHTGNMKPFPVM